MTENHSICTVKSHNYTDLTQEQSIRILLVGLYVFTCILTAVGNTIIIISIWRQIRCACDIYIFNLAVQDALIGIVVMPFKLIEYAADCSTLTVELLSDVLCGILSYLQPSLVFSSIFTLAAISLERYAAIVHPLATITQSKLSRAKKVLVVTWIFPLLLTTPYLMAKTQSFELHSNYGRISRRICSPTFVILDNWLGYETDFRRKYFILLFVGVYLIPTLIILITCIAIVIKLRRTPINAVSVSLGRRKAARMIVVISFAFTIAWAPHFGISLEEVIRQDKSFLKASQFIFAMLLTHLCAFAHSAINPIIYVCMSKRMKNLVKSLFIKNQYTLACRHSTPTRLTKDTAL